MMQPRDHMSTAVEYSLAPATGHSVGENVHQRPWPWSFGERVRGYGGHMRMHSDKNLPQDAHRTAVTMNQHDGLPTQSSARPVPELCSPESAAGPQHTG